MLVGTQEIPPFTVHTIHLLHIWLQMEDEEVEGEGVKREKEVIRCVFSVPLKCFFCKQLRGSYIHLAAVGTIPKQLSSKQHLKTFRDQSVTFTNTRTDPDLSKQYKNWHWTHKHAAAETQQETSCQSISYRIWLWEEKLLWGHFCFLELIQRN